MPVNNPYITDPWRDDKLGSDCSGTDGAKNRTLTLSKTTGCLAAIAITANGTSLHQGAGKDFTFAQATGVVTFLNAIDNTDNISVLFYTR